MGAHVGGLNVVPLLGAIKQAAMVRCRCWVPLDRVPLMDAMVGWHGRVPLLDAI